MSPEMRVGSGVDDVGWMTRRIWWEWRLRSLARRSTCTSDDVKRHCSKLQLTQVKAVPREWSARTIPVPVENRYWRLDASRHARAPSSYVRREILLVRASQGRPCSPFSPSSSNCVSTTPSCHAVGVPAELCNIVHRDMHMFLHMHNGVRYLYAREQLAELQSHIYNITSNRRMCVPALHH